MLQNVSIHEVATSADPGSIEMCGKSFTAMNFGWEKTLYYTSSLDF